MPVQNKYLTVTALTRYIKRKIDTDPHLKSVWLKGEISNFNHHSRGHMYLTIKDDDTRIQAVMFAGNNRSLKFIPENGMNVLIKGEVSVFEPFGQYQLYIQQMEPDGLGSLYLAYEQLKEKLDKKGYFKEGNKQSIPPFPEHIGIVTSPTGAAARDIITTIKRRYPIVKTTIIPAIVQGSTAANSIKKAIETANNKNVFDVLIVGRGGGAIEDLWGFNEEIVANAIFHSNIPIVSAVGHETDTTISDFTADLRAPTPTAAAELVVPSQIELREKINSMSNSLILTMKQRVEKHTIHLQRLTQSYAFRYPEQLIKQKEQELDTFTGNLNDVLNRLVKTKSEILINMKRHLLNQLPTKQFEQSTEQYNYLVEQMNNSMTNIFKEKSKQLMMNIDKLSLLNPLEIMRRGFAIPYSRDKQLMTSIKQVEINDEITVQLHDGVVECNVSDKKEKSIDHDG